MTTISPQEVTRLLADWSKGDRSALDKLFPLVHAELRRIARRQMSKESPGHTLQATALVNEAYLKLVDQTRANWKDRAHFLSLFAVCAQVMRHILIDHARGHARAKRGGGAIQVSLNEAAVMAVEQAADFVALDVALRALDDPDVFIAADLGVRRALQRLGGEAGAAERWRPFRSYATHHLWASGAAGA